MTRLTGSPRWLCQMGRIDDAKRSITKLRKGTDDAGIIIELDSIQAAINVDKQNAAATGWGQLFRGSDLRRTLTVVGVMSIAQANGTWSYVSILTSGLAFLGNYAVVYLTAVGIKNVYVILMICESGLSSHANDSIRRHLRQHYCRFLDSRSFRETNSALVDWLCSISRSHQSRRRHFSLSSPRRSTCLCCCLSRVPV